MKAISVLPYFPQNLYTIILDKTEINVAISYLPLLSENAVAGVPMLPSLAKITCFGKGTLTPHAESSLSHAHFSAPAGRALAILPARRAVITLFPPSDVSMYVLQPPAAKGPWLHYPMSVVCHSWGFQQHAAP